jgi:thioredoxin reductase (NADPH)
MDKPFLPKELRDELRKSFTHMKGDVSVAVLTSEKINPEYNKVATQLLSEFSEVEERIKLSFESLDGTLATERGITTSPTILIGFDKYDIRLIGAPMGEEGRTLVTALIMASSGKGIIENTSVAEMKKLKDKRNVKVFVSPT